MKQHYKEGFDHEAGECIGVLLTNLGTPERADRSAVKRFLKEFLSDPRVVEGPRLPWWLVLNLIILNTRPKRTAAAYRKVWTEQGSPLMVISQSQSDALADHLAERGIKVELGMRYGQPSLAVGLERLRQQGATRILVLPLYPQYSATTTATTVDAIGEELRSWRRMPEMRYINHYHDNSKYIDALACSVEDHWRNHARAELLLLSFHGIPQQYFEQGDPYFCECQKTARLLAERLELSRDQWQISFQSRLGPKKWLQPYTDETLKQLAHDEIRSVQILCPGFSVDCLETLEEIAIENRQVFLDAGGEQYDYIPCLNDSAAHIEMMADIVVKNIGGWQTAPEDSEFRMQRVNALKQDQQSGDN